MFRLLRLSLRLRATVAIVIGIAALTLSPTPARAENLRDLIEVFGVRDNQLIGYGIVSGLNGTGDDVSAPFAMQSLRALLRRLGVQVPDKQLRLKNVAAVVVTSTLPAFARSGTRIDVTISSIGNAKSLRGGVLLQAPLHGADRKVYAVSQGPVLIGGFEASGKTGSSVRSNITTAGRIPGGALVERSVRTKYSQGGRMLLSLKSPDFTNAQRIADAINRKMGDDTAEPVDSGAVEVRMPEKQRDKPVAFLARLGDIEVTPVTHARVVINEKTGTIVIGGSVQLTPVAISQGGITIAVKEDPFVSQPDGIFSSGETKVVQRSEVDPVEETPPSLTYLDGAATLADVASALSTFGVSPRELASILQALKTAGALRAEIVVQ